MKRAILAATLLLALLIVAYAYTVTRREHVYRQLVVQGDLALARGDGFSAVAAFSAAVSLKPDSMLGYLKRGEAHRRRGDLEAAARDLAKASALDPAAPRALELRGDVDAARQQHDSAVQHYAAAVALDDRSPRVLYKLGLARHVIGHSAEASDALTRAIRLDDRFAEAHYLLGVCLREMNKLREAEQALKRAVALAPSLLAAREQLADLYGSAGRRADRVKELEQLLSADPGPARQVALAMAYADAGQTPRALRMLRSAAELYPDHAGTHLAFGNVWLEVAEASGDQGALRKALEALQDAVSLDASGAALTQLGKARLLASEHALAHGTLREATEKRTVAPAAFLLLADAAERSGDAHGARQALLDYHDLTGSGSHAPPAISERIADLSMRIGEPLVAVRWYETASDASRATPALLVRLAHAQWQAGDAAGARATLDKVFEKNPDHAEARALERRLDNP